LKELKGVKSLITLDQFKVIKQKTEEVWSEKYVKEMEKEKKRGNFDLANAIADILTKGIDKDRTLINRQKELALKAYFDSVDSLDL
jgi:Cu2+-containing amine oxidase